MRKRSFRGVLFLSVALFAVLASCACLVGATNPFQDYTSRDEFQQLDDAIVEMLQAQLPLEEFTKQMRKHAKAKHVRFMRTNIYDLHKLYEARRTFNEPCKLKSLFVFANAYIRYAAVLNKGIRRIMRVLIRDFPGRRYALKCVSEFDAYLGDFEDSPSSVAFMTRLAKAISGKTRSSLMFWQLELELDLSAADNRRLKSRIGPMNVRYSAICRRVLRDSVLQEIFAMMQKILGKMRGLRSPEVVDKLNEQIQAQGANTIKFVSLMTFCSNLKRKGNLL